MKLKLSPLRSKLFNYNLIDNPFCPACNGCIETPIHSFIDCHAYHVFRQTMLSRLHDLNPHLVSPKDFVEFILDGSKSGNRDHHTSANKAIFRHVCNFIYNTKRFTQNINKWSLPNYAFRWLLLLCVYYLYHLFHSFIFLANIMSVMFEEL